MTLCSWYVLCARMEELAFKIVKSFAHGDEVIARAADLAVARAAFEKAVFVYPTEHVEMRQGARIIARSKED